MLEAYQAYGDYRSMMDLTEACIVDAIRATGQPLKLPWGDTTIDFTPPFARKTYDELFQEHAGRRRRPTRPPSPTLAKSARPRNGRQAPRRHQERSLRSQSRRRRSPARSSSSTTRPASARSPSARPTTQRLPSGSSCIVQGMEIANAYTELNDPDLQEKLFKTQLAGLAEEESMAKMDHDFIRALRHGMPPGRRPRPRHRPPRDAADQHAIHPRRDSVSIACDRNDGLMLELYVPILA